MAIAGRVAIVPQGDWSTDATYKRLDAVTYNNTLYFAKKDVPAGTVTSNTEYWSKSIVGGVGAIATTEEAGIVKPADGLTVAEDGTLKVNIDGTTLTMDQVNNVIKLADTLKDAINGAFPAANVANNQITTVEGFALDARQANPNLDGTLAKQISDLNGSKADQNTFNHDAYNSWMQTPLRESKYLSRVYASFDKVYRAYIGTQLIDSNGIESDFIIASSRYGYAPLVLDSSKDLNDVLGNRFLQVFGSKNVPKSGMNFFGLCISWIGDDGYATQILFAPNEDMISGSTYPRIYIRSKNNNVWTSWRVITTASL